MASEDTVDLLPCPFCGSAARIERYGNNRMSTIYQCDECGCMLETGETFNHGARWNKRAAIDAAAAVDGDAQREALAQFMIKHSFPTGHGDAHADLLVELDAAMQESNDGLWNAAISEAEELLRTAGGICKSSVYVACADAIRSLKGLKCTQDKFPENIPTIGTTARSPIQTSNVESAAAKTSNTANGSRPAADMTTHNILAKTVGIHGGSKALTREAEMNDDIETRPKDSNADAWHLFLSEYLDARANSPSGLTFMAVQVAEAIDDAEKRGETAKLPCGHHVSCLVKSVESTNQFCGFCDIMSQRNDAEMMEAQYQMERDALRKSLDDRFAADLKAAKAIFADTGRTSGFPSVKEVVAWYVAEVERLSNRLEWEKLCHRVATEKLVPIETERDSVRAKLERAKEALREIGKEDGPSLCGLGQAKIAQATLSELSADAPAQQTQISDEVREAMAEAERALAAIAAHDFGFCEDKHCASAALAKLRSVMK